MCCSLRSTPVKRSMTITRVWWGLFVAGTVRWPVPGCIPVPPESPPLAGSGSRCQCRTLQTWVSAPSQSSSRWQTAWRTWDWGSSGFSPSGQSNADTCVRDYLQRQLFYLHKMRRNLGCWGFLPRTSEVPSCSWEARTEGRTLRRYPCRADSHRTRSAPPWSRSRWPLAPRMQLLPSQPGGHTLAQTEQGHTVKRKGNSSIYWSYTEQRAICMLFIRL